MFSHKQNIGNHISGYIIEGSSSKTELSTSLNKQKIQKKRAAEETANDAANDGLSDNGTKRSKANKVHTHAFHM